MEKTKKNYFRSIIAQYCLSISAKYRFRKRQKDDCYRTCRYATHIQILVAAIARQNVQ